MNDSLVIKARQLTKAFNGTVVVRAIDLDVPRGGCFGLLGPNGAGKTTTLRMILGQSPITSGELKVLDQPMPGAKRDVRARIGVVPQADNLDPELTVLENLLVYASYFGLAKSAITPRLEELLRMVELEDRADTPINTLSGGMKRRLSIARAMINDPELLVLDEPTTGLDPQVRHLIWNRLRQLKQSGTTLLLTTHYMEEAERLCDDLVVIDEGRIISHGQPQALIREHVESDVIEIHGDDTHVQTLLNGIGGLRIKNVGETVYCYTRSPAAIVEALKSSSDVTYMHRPANLEDLFLDLTGHELRE